MYVFVPSECVSCMCVYHACVCTERVCVSCMCVYPACVCVSCMCNSLCGYKVQRMLLLNRYKEVFWLDSGRRCYKAINYCSETIHAFNMIPVEEYKDQFEEIYQV